MHTGYVFTEYMHAEYASRKNGFCGPAERPESYRRGMADDPRLNAARYRAEKAARDTGFDGADGPEPVAPPTPDSASPSGGAAQDATPPRTPTAGDRAAYVETAIQQAIRRGDFDDLPGAGKPLEGLGNGHDPDWWIRRKIQSEQLTGLGPPALRLRVEHAEFEERLDALSREDDVRDYIADFNARVIDARRQLLGGPPVVTPTRDTDEEVAAWRARRDARAAAQANAQAPGERPSIRRRSRRGWLRRR